MLGKDPFFTSMVLVFPPNEIQIEADELVKTPQEQLIQELFYKTSRMLSELKTNEFPPDKFKIVFYEYLMHSRAGLQPSNGNYTRVYLSDIQRSKIKIKKIQENRCEYKIYLGKSDYKNLDSEAEILFKKLFFLYINESVFRQNMESGQEVDFDEIKSMFNHAYVETDLAKKEYVEIFNKVISDNSIIERPINILNYYFEKTGTFVILSNNVFEKFKDVNFNLILAGQIKGFKYLTSLTNNIFIKKLIESFYQNEGKTFELLEKNENRDDNITLETSIYYGPPGTGKTTVAKNKIATILGFDDQIKLNQNKQWQIIQIHPSYGYEDFVEGIKPVTYSNGEIKYEVVDGPVKVLANKALENQVHVLCYINSRGKIHLPQGFSSKYDLSNIYASRTKEFINDLIDIDGDQFENRDYLFKEYEYKENGCYEKLFIKGSDWSKNKNYVLVLDELNRGHIATILGELIFALSEIQADFPKAVRLQYSNDEFFWPKNLSLIGTMNTADTTTDKIDQAIKRRFEFIELPPKQKPEDWKQFNLKVVKSGSLYDYCVSKFGKDSSYNPWSILYNLNDLLQRKASDYGAIAIHEKLIGHSYFIKYIRLLAEAEIKNDNLVSSVFDLKAKAIEILAELFEKEIYPSMLNIFNNNYESLKDFKTELEKKEIFKDIKKRTVTSDSEINSEPDIFGDDQTLRTGTNG